MSVLDLFFAYSLVGVILAVGGCVFIALIVIFGVIQVGRIKVYQQVRKRDKQMFESQIHQVASYGNVIPMTDIVVSKGQAKSG